MKICVIAPTVIPIEGRSQKYGGIESVITLVTNELVNRGHEVYLFACGGSKTKSHLKITAPKPVGQGINIDQEKNYNLKAYQQSLKLKPDVIWDNTLAIHAQKYGKDFSKYLFKVDIQLNADELLKTAGIPIVHTLHGPAKDHLPKLIHDLSIQGHYFVSISKDQARRYLKFIKKTHHLGTVYNPIDLNFYKPPPGQPARNYYLWVGRYGMEKGPHIALATAHRLNIPLKLVGKRTEPHEKAYFKEFIQPFLLPSDKVLNSSISTLKKVKLYQEAKMTLMTNLWAEPFGLVIGESMACGTPVIGPALGSLTELIDSSGILVPVKDLSLDENEIEVSIKQLKYIDRLVRYLKNSEPVPPEVPRKRAEFLFSPKTSASGYEEAFIKAAYLCHRKLKLG